MEKVKPSSELRTLLDKIDRRSYPAYKDTKGAYQFPGYVLCIDHVQGDPFAAPSSLHVTVRGERAGFPRELYAAKERRIALEDELLRCFVKEISRFNFAAKGSGKSGLIAVSRPGQEILERTASHIDAATGDVTIRFAVGFPANGRTINSRELLKILFDFLPKAVGGALLYESLPAKHLEEIAFLADDQAFIRNELSRLDFVAFVADGSVLPRKSGVSDLPMKEAVAFYSPGSMKIQLDLPSGKKVEGMGIKRGVTLIVGGGYHGKSTLLSALEKGVYNHRKGDGREYVITDASAVKLRAEDGRSIRRTDISMFINDLPNGKDTTHFYTEDASGSTSQAASVVEAMEAGATAFLIDEDTSATNFMIRDELMGLVIDSKSEPITPFIARIRQMYEEFHISTVIVAGSSGSYFHVADTVIQMEKYEPKDITEKAKEAADRFPLKQKPSLSCKSPDFARRPKKNRALLGDGRVKIKTGGTDTVIVNKETVDVRYLEQLTDPEQLSALANMMVYMEKNMFDGKRTLQECVRELYEELDKKGPAFLGGGASAVADMAMPRPQELFACLDRYRGLGL